MMVGTNGVGGAFLRCFISAVSQDVSTRMQGKNPFPAKRPLQIIAISFLI
jgi:hypothetical protein